MKITPKDFVEVLVKTSLTTEERKAVVELLKNLSVDQIEDLYKILLNDAKNTQKTMQRLEMRSKQELLKLKKDVKNQK